MVLAGCLGHYPGTDLTGIRTENTQTDFYRIHMLNMIKFRNISNSSHIVYSILMIPSIQCPHITLAEMRLSLKATGYDTTRFRLLLL